MSTDSGSSDASAEDPTATWSPDMFDPVLVAVDLAPHGGVEDLLELAGHRSRLPPDPDHPVVDGAYGHHLGRRPRQKRLLGRVQVGPQNVADLHLVVEIPGDGHDR